MRMVRNNNRSNKQKSNVLHGAHFLVYFFAISKKATFYMQHLFLYISLPLFCMTTTWNFQKLPGYTFYGGNVVCVLVHIFFSLLLIFTMVTASISHFLTTAKTLHVVPPTKNVFFSDCIAIVHYMFSTHQLNRFKEMCHPHVYGTVCGI